MKIQPVKGTRDFYPDMMAVHNHIVDGWKSASARNGFEEYDGPIFEYLKMYQVKSGDEIVEQLFNLTDRGGRHLAIRPEITPTLARMVNQQINALPKPIKWFSVPRLCRAERPQKGRLREFYQWNIDIIGVDDPRADAEIIYTSIDYLCSTGLTSKDIQAKISSRKLLAALLLNVGIDETQLDPLYALLDKKAKLPDEAFSEALQKLVPDESSAVLICRLMEVRNPGDLSNVLELSEDAVQALEELKQLFVYLDLMGISDYCSFDMGIVRGLAYYTGMVFEVHDTCGEFRALCGGGRFDNLLKDFGGPSIPATGMGMGDCVLEILLREKGLIDDSMPSKSLDYYVVALDDELADQAVRISASIRQAGKSAEFCYKTGSLKKLLKQASAANAGCVIILGREFIEDKKLVIKDMKTSDQTERLLQDFLSDITG